MQQCGPYNCDSCHASQIGPYDEDRPISENEKQTGWYAPGEKAGSTANVIGGRIVSHVQARNAYREEFSGNPLWHDKKYVDEWWKSQRE